MKRFTLMSIACSACWGAGPTPTSPSGAEVIFKVLPTYGNEFCNNERYPYIGDVAFGGDYAYAAEMHFTPPMNNCNGDMGPTQMTSKPVRAHRIPLDGGQATSVTAGSSQGQITTRVVSTPSRGGFVHSPDPGSRLELRGDEVPQQDLMYTGGYFVPVGLVADDTHAFVIATSGAPRISSEEVNSPRYPCCSNTGTSTSGSTPGTIAFKVAWDASTSPQQISIPPDGYVIADSLKSGVVANKSTVFYAMRERVSGTGVDVDLLSMPKNDTTAFTHFAGITTDVGVPVGLAASDSVLAWTIAPSYAELPIPDPHCRLITLDPNTAEAQESVHFMSNDFSCQDLAIDETHAYFMIVKVEQDDRSDNNPGDMRGIGIGRVSLTSPALFESVTIGDGDSQFSGPRRVYIHGDDLYLVDPFAIARISKTALDGKADF